MIAVGDFFMRNDLKAVGVYIATLIGAGFASGSEILFYFARYGKLGFFAIVISAFLLAAFAAAVLELSKRHEITDFGSFLRMTFGMRLYRVISALIYFFIFVTFCTMISGSAASLSDTFGITRRAGAAAVAAVVFLILIFGARGLCAADSFMSVFIIMGILCICFYLYTFREISTFSGMTRAIASGTVYAGYNTVTAGGVLVGFSEKVKSPKRVGVVSGMIIFVLLLLLWGIISMYYGKIPLGELPMLTICRRHGSAVYNVYFAVLFLAMISTAVSNAFLLTDNAKNARFLRLGGVMIVGFALSGLPLEFFVDRVYRAIGGAGVVVMVIILIKNMIKK